MISSILLIALLPIAILLIYIYRADKRSPEPASQLLKAFFFGTLCVPITLVMTIPMEAIGLFTYDPTTISGAISTSFFGAAIPEEGAKLLMLWLLLRKNRHFDERLDGIVYAVFVSLGFAAIENIMYLFENYDSFIIVGITRGVLSIPLHFACGVLMGYFYSMTSFGKKFRVANTLMIYIAPVVIHGIYDSILFSLGTMGEGSELTILFMFYVLVTFCIITLLVCYNHILKTRRMDIQDPNIIPGSFTDKVNGYTPQPIDFTGIQLPDELEGLMENLSRNVHEVWAQERLKEGWTYGTQRNDIIKKHPCLVPYEMLSESEKEYDRNTAMGTIKFIINSGYSIVKSEETDEYGKNGPVQDCQESAGYATVTEMNEETEDITFHTKEMPDTEEATREQTGGENEEMPNP